MSFPLNAVDAVATSAETLTPIQIAPVSGCLRQVSQAGSGVSVTFVGPVLLCRALSSLVRDQLGRDGACTQAERKGSPDVSGGREDVTQAVQAVEAVQVLVLIVTESRSLQALLAAPEIVRLRQGMKSDARIVLLCAGSEKATLLPEYTDALSRSGKPNADPVCVSLDAEPEVLMDALALALAAKADTATREWRAMAPTPITVGKPLSQGAVNRTAQDEDASGASPNRKRGSVSGSARGSGSSARPCGLSARENEVAALAAQALSNAQIAARLGITVATVKWNLQRVFAKLQIKRRSQLMHCSQLMRSEYFL